MSVDYHRHCQATVLGAAGTAQGNGLTWGTLWNLNTPNLGDEWKQSFLYSKNITDDLAQIILLIENHMATGGGGETYNAGDLISIDNYFVGVKNRIESNYQGPVGIENAEGGRRLVPCNITVENIDEDGEIIAWLVVGENRIPIRANIQAQPPDEDRYVITEDRLIDIVLSGGDNDGEPLDYNDDQEPEPEEQRYVVTENGHQYDIGVSGYGDSVLLNYNED